MKHDLDNPPVLYKVVGKYRKVNHGTTRIFASDGFDQHLLRQVGVKTDRRLFSIYADACKKQTDLFDKDTNIKIDFVCD